MNRNMFRFLLVSIPFIALFIAMSILLAINKDISNSYDSSWKLRQFVLAIFVLAGATIIPNLLHLNLFFINNRPKIIINLQHHPPELQAEHEVLFRSHYYCAGCTGSAIGVLLTEALLLLYFFLPNLFNSELVDYFLLLGVFLVLITFVRYFLELNPVIRLFQHISLFPGLAFLIISLDIIASSAFIMIILLPIWLLFLFTRIYLAKIDHRGN
ncbi:MAG: hypothetical protein ACTSR2_08255 [Candidatus Hodarchaeales archaeon]